MQLTVTRAAIQEFEADAIVVNLFQGVHRPGGATGAVDAALGGHLSELIAAGDVRGRAGEVTVLYPRGTLPARRILVVGLGERERFDLEGVRRAAAAAARRAAELGVETLASIVHGAGIGGLEVADAAQATVEGTLLALWRYRQPARPARVGASAPTERTPAPTRLELVEFDEDKLEAVRAGARVAEAVVAGVALARQLVTLPANHAPPRALAEAARDTAERHGLELTVGDRTWADARGMGAFLAVARGAAADPAFIVLEHNAGRPELPTLVLVGKGVTFDSGGLSLKSRTGMVPMKSDMAGAAAVLGAMETVARLDLPLHVVALAPCTENMPDGAAYRPSDVVVAANGTSIEIISTDAEGRLALADALCFAAGFEPAAVVDVATLTGSCVTALGEGVAAGLFANDEALAAHLQAAAGRTRERLWRLPLYPDYRETIASPVADVKNSGGARGGVGTSAAFLQEFVSFPWAHLDIAGMALASTDAHYTPKGGTGFGVRLLVEALRSWGEAAVGVPTDAP